MIIETKYDPSQVVYLITDPEQLPRIVTEIVFCGVGGLKYGLNCGSEFSEHYEFEMQEEVNYNIKLGLN